MLINATRDFIEEKSKFENQCVKIAIIKGSKTKMNGCWSFERQINLIKDEIKKIKSIKGELRMKLKNIKTKDHNVKDTKCSIKEIKCIIEKIIKDCDQLRVCLWNNKKIKTKIDFHLLQKILGN